MPSMATDGIYLPRDSLNTLSECMIVFVEYKATDEYRNSIACPVFSTVEVPSPLSNNRCHQKILHTTSSCVPLCTSAIWLLGAPGHMGVSISLHPVYQSTLPAGATTRMS